MVHNKKITFSEACHFISLHCPLPWGVNTVNFQAKAHVKIFSRAWYLTSLQELQDRIHVQKWWHQSRRWISEMKYFWRSSWTRMKVMGNYLVAFFKGILVIQHGFKIPPLKYSAVSHKWPDNQTWVQNLSLMTLNVGKMMDLIGVFVTAWARAHRYECESVTKRFTLLSMIHWEFTCSFCPSFFSEMSHSTVWG